MFHLFDNTYTGTRMERGLRDWLSDKYDRVSHGASDAYDSTRDSLSSLGRYGRSWGDSARNSARNFHCHAQEHHDPAFHAISHVGTGLVCFVLGAGVAFYFDRNNGRRRRALVRDKFYSLGRQTARSLAREGRHVGSRSRGMAHDAKRLFRHDQATDEKLVARVRSRLGRFASNAHGINVSAADGVVTLSGPVLTSEMDNVLWAVKKVPGLADLRCELKPQESFQAASR